MSEINFSFCPACGAKLPRQAKFCPACGSALGDYTRATSGQIQQQTQFRTPIQWSTKHYVVLGCLTLLIWLPAWEFQQWRGGTRPTQPFSAAVGTAPAAAPSSDASVSESPEIAKLESAAKAAPDNVEAQQLWAAALVNKLRQSDSPPNELILSTVDALDAVLKVSPKDPDALMAMGDISFNQQVFGKAVDFYSRYLAIQPSDNDARARYGSALTFAGKFPDAVAELKTVLEKDPKNFHGAAYLAITYAQMGDQTSALSAGEKALTLAPNEEARARFSEFMNDVKNPRPKRGNVSDKNSDPHSEAALAAAAQASATVSDANVSANAKALSEMISKNPVAGPKFAEARDLDNGAIGLYFSEFPMDQMPPFVREKFVGEIKHKAFELGVKTVVFFDKESGREMLRTPVE